jgi:signal peptidase I
MGDGIPACSVVQSSSRQSAWLGVGHVAQSAGAVPATILKQLIRFATLLICFALIVRTFFVDSYVIPTGSMAPKFVGIHRTCICPRCGSPVQIGLHPRDASDAPHDYSRAWCANCGVSNLPLLDASIIPGQRLLVNKAAFVARSPRRWEVIVFHLFGLDFIKRLLGLPGETVEICDGDLFVDGALCRKTLDQFKAMRILAFDNNYQPQPMTWAARWESAPYRQESPLDGTQLRLDAGPDAWHLIAYRHFDLDTRKFLPIMDEYGYNSADPRRLVPVHDVMLECDLEFQASGGSFALGITDGHDHVIAELPLVDRSPEQPSGTLRAVPAFSLPALQERTNPPLAVSGVSLAAGKRYHVEWALVDRRLTLRIDGVDAFVPVDLPACGERAALVRPVMLAIHGGTALASNVRLWRDVHYTQAGTNGVKGAVVRLGPDQYFVLGDNSPASEDSRFWPDGGAVPGSSLIGTPLLVFRP